MKTNLTLLLLVFGITLSYQNSFGKNNVSISDSLSESTIDSKVDLIDGCTYKNAILYTPGGNKIQGDITFRGDNITILKKGSKISLDISMQKIQRIDVPIEPVFSKQISCAFKKPLLD